VLEKHGGRLLTLQPLALQLLALHACFAGAVNTRCACLLPPLAAAGRPGVGDEQLGAGRGDCDKAQVVDRSPHDAALQVRAAASQPANHSAASCLAEPSRTAQPGIARGCPAQRGAHAAWAASLGTHACPATAGFAPLLAWSAHKRQQVSCFSLLNYVPPAAPAGHVSWYTST